jgi:exopolyphosphatase/guanosine-5'-triphosphate,3'-diphosphate pyrophosphatase
MVKSNGNNWRNSGEVRHDGRIGVIDIGSNSIRLVVYDGIKRSPLPIFNEKMLCGLGKGLAVTGKLNPEGVKLAKICIKRFLALVRIMDVVELQVIATAAVRDASDGAEFVESLERKHRISITVVSGKKEAQLAASGVFSSIYKPSGLAGDLGGASMELISLDNLTIHEQTTIPIGPLRLIDAGKGDKAKTGKIIKNALEAESWLGKIHPEHFYAIGGSFRSLAHIHILKEEYPLDIVHHYTVKTGAMRKFLKEIIHSSLGDLEKMPGASAKRAESLIPAAQIMDEILDLTNPVDVIFCSTGIREGYLYEKLSPFLRNEDPLIASCTDLAAQSGDMPGFARELFNWMSPMFEKENDSRRRLRFAACILSEIAWKIHREYRAHWAFFTVLESTLAGLSHPERIMLALALYHRHQFKLKMELEVFDLLEEEDLLWAKLVGTASNVAFILSGGMPGNLDRVTLTQGRGGVEAHFDEHAQDLLSEAVEKRIDSLSETFKAFMKARK